MSTSVSTEVKDKYQLTLNDLDEKVVRRIKYSQIKTKEHYLCMGEHPHRENTFIKLNRSYENLKDHLF
jgi:hypothetical protein